ncbi:MAG TPA: CoA transferase [Xanthobacteraceae bacterium]|jgi:crotonobetainyl-CoA:carnitine CoA-transferase CaiB-like acyl-CoA transferase
MLLSDVIVVDATDRPGWLAGRILADLGAEVLRVDPPDTDRATPDWRALNVSKRLVDFDLEQADHAARFEQLLARADICLVTPASFAAGGRLDPHRLRAAYPQLVVVAITPFGRGGPRRGWRASDIEIMAAGGAMALAGEPDGVPLRLSEPQSHGWAAAQAATGALVGLCRREISGCGELVDVSAQASVVAAIAHAPAFVDLLGVEPRRAGAWMTGRSIYGARYRVFWPCKDGWVNFIFYGGRAGRRTNEQLVAWMREGGADPGALAGIDWARFDPTQADQKQVDALEAPVLAFFAGVTKREFLMQTHGREMLGYPVSTVADIAADPQLIAREFFETIVGADGRKETFCGSFAVIDGKRPSVRRAFEPDCRRAHPAPARASFEARARVLRDGALKERASSGRGRALAPQDDARRPSPSRGGSKQALADLKVACFGGYGAGPHIGKVLANFGARVVHVEAKDHPDGFRLEYPPFAGNRPGINRGGCFSFLNDSKYGVTIDLKKPEGMELARRLAGWCDLIIENMRPGVMARLGLGFETLAEINPRLVMLSTCNMGQTGPRALQPGFGSQLSALAGFCGITGFPDGPPMLLYGPYIDFIASALGGCAALAGVLHSRRSGRGSHIDLSQYECGLMLMAGALQDYFDNGRVRSRCGNDDAEAAPHGAFPCRDGEWVALSCWSEAEFAALARLLGTPCLAGEQRFATAAARRTNAEVLGTIISAWTRNQRAGEAAEALQRAGIAAYPVVTVSGLFSDPQLLARRQWRVRRHPEIGDQAFCFPGFDLESAPGDIVCAAPCLGADNDFVFRELLCIADADMKRYTERGVFG